MGLHRVASQMCITKILQVKLSSCYEHVSHTHRVHRQDYSQTHSAVLLAVTNHKNVIYP